MYDYNFENEKVVKEETYLNIKFNKNYFLGSVLLSNKNLLIFFDANKDNALGSGTQVVPAADDAKTAIENNILIYNFNLEKFLK